MISAEEIDEMIIRWRGQNEYGNRPYMGAAADMAEKILKGELKDHAEIPRDIDLPTPVGGSSMLRARTLLVVRGLARRQGSRIYVTWDGAA